ncbi:MAG TPA: carbohydrate-binding domain-containing protein [Devosia sp.]|nr:carbohydrate-binding domain-containing protein [Devosia sp.]
MAHAETVLLVSIAGEAFDGPPAFEIAVGGKVIGSGVLSNAIETATDGRLFTKPRPNLYLEQFTFHIPDDQILPDKDISIALANDKFANAGGAGEDGIRDRNLYVDYISVNGVEVNSAEMILTHKGTIQLLDYQAGLMPIYEAGYLAVAKAPAGGWTSALQSKSSAQSPKPALASSMQLALDGGQR